ncbi:replication protein H [Halobacteriales archaeon QS_1_69_70]|nr:MAG: replication protein H [Halobacteriales archaeon QS_1_69_70]
MYAVVGCSNCRALWVVEDRPETTQCPRCRTRHRFERLKVFAEAEAADAAARARGELLAERAEAGEFVEPAAVDADAVGMTEEAFLAASGLDAEEVTAAGDRRGPGEGSRSRRQVVLDALADLEAPTGDDLRAYAAEHGVEAEYVDRALAKLERSGEVTRADGVYRRL